MDNTKFDIKHLLTFGGVIAVAIASSYVIRGYLDLLRIKALKRHIKQVEPQPMEQPQDESQPMEQNTEMEQGGQVEEQYQEDPDKIVLNWGEVFTFFK